jgi:hypothetical protein
MVGSRLGGMVGLHYETNMVFYYRDIGVIFSWCGEDRQEWDCEGCDCSGYIDENSVLVITNHCDEHKHIDRIAWDEELENSHM